MQAIETAQRPVTDAERGKQVQPTRSCFKGAASDVLADLTKRWIAAFQKIHPDVSIDLPPPYAGSLGAIELIKDIAANQIVTIREGSGIVRSTGSGK